MSEIKITNPPGDCISSLSFGPSQSQFLIASSWDGSVRLYDVNENSLRFTYHHSKPVLDCCFQDSVQVLSGGLDKTLKLYNCNTASETTIGKHDEAIKCVEYCPEFNAVLTGSWDSTVKMWDPRSPNGCVGSLAQTDKVYTMSLCGDKLLVGTAGRKVLIWDLRNTSVVSQKRDSSLRYQTRCIKSFPNKQGYILSSIEGRVAVEYLDPTPDVQRLKYAFKCHRVKDGSMEKIYPVNALAFHNAHSTFASGGSDGYVNIWDGFNKKRLCQFHKYPTSITALSFDGTGTMLAIASSYMFEDDQMEAPYPEDAIYIRKVTDHETKPK